MGKIVRELNRSLQSEWQEKIAILSMLVREEKDISNSAIMKYNIHSYKFQRKTHFYKRTVIL